MRNIMKVTLQPAPTRRTLLAGLAGAAATAGLTVLAPSPGQASPNGPWNTTQNSTANGWPVIPTVNDSRLTSFVVEGTGIQLTAASGNAATVLAYVIRRFHYEVGEIRPQELKAYRPVAPVTSPRESNYFSGTAVEIKPELYPLGVGGGFFPPEVVVIRDILAQCEGLVQWGADNSDSPHESHFELCVAPGDKRLATLAARLKNDLTVPGRGPGADMDAPWTDRRKEAADNLKSRQKRTN
jgi:hypothetical protein